MKNRKFELFRDAQTPTGFFRIRALVSFGFVLKGEVGGFVQKCENLSETGYAWVSGNARVAGYARVLGYL